MRRALLATLLLLVAGCGGSDEPAALTVHLGGANDSGQTGTATLTDVGQSGTTIVLEVSPPDRYPGDVQPAEVMEASCAELLEFDSLDEQIAAVGHHLTEVRDGRSQTTGTSMDELRSGKYSIAVFQQAPPYKPVVCGDIPER